MVDIMIRCMDGFVISVFEGIELGCFVGFIDGGGDDVVGPFVDLGLVRGMYASDIDCM